MQDKVTNFLINLACTVMLVGSVLILVVAFGRCAHGQQLCDLAPEWRQHNWGSPGSCGHASTVSALRWVQEFDKAAEWKSKYSNGESFNRHLSRLRANGIPFIETHDGDSSIFEVAAKLRRMAVVYWPQGHITDEVGLDASGHLFILDNNHVKRFDQYQQRDWYSRWRQCSGSAFVILSGSPPPPVPE